MEQKDIRGSDLLGIGHHWVLKGAISTKPFDLQSPGLDGLYMLVIDVNQHHIQPLFKQDGTEQRPHSSGANHGNVVVSHTHWRVQFN